MIKRKNDANYKKPKLTVQPQNSEHTADFNVTWQNFLHRQRQVIVYC